MDTEVTMNTANEQGEKFIREIDSDRLHDQMVSVMRARAAVVAMASAVVDAKEAGAPSENLNAIIEQLAELLKTERTERKAFATLAVHLNRGGTTATE